MQSEKIAEVRNTMDMHIRIVTGLFAAALAASTNAQAGTLPLTDSAVLRSGTYADTPQAWTTALAIKNADGNNCRIAMLKADLSSLTGKVSSAVLTLRAKDDEAYTLYAYGIKETAGFRNWTGGVDGTATWNSVSANGLFDPATDLYQSGHPNLVLLGSWSIPGSGNEKLDVTLSGANLLELINQDSDDKLTFVFTIDKAVNTAIRPHNYFNAPCLKFNYTGDIESDEPTLRADEPPQSATETFGFVL